MNIFQKIPYHLWYLYKTEFLRKEVIRCCRKEAENADERKAAELKEVETYLQKYCFTLFPYRFIKKYDKIRIEVERDEEGSPFVYRGSKKLFFPEKWSDERCRNYYREILTEQDKESPHCYISDDKRLPGEGDSIADVGGAEGFFALDHIERAGKVYIFECEEEWQEPLRKTFSPWKDKVEIINKYVGDKDDEGRNFVTLDSFFRDKKCDYVKADIEGAETALLKGGESTFRNKVRKTLLCAYHNQDDEEKINRYLEEYGFTHEPSHGFMLMAAGYLNGDKDSFKPPYLRRGVIFGSR
ncbi:MAG: FkbM family methyltransferase [Lachnospiraceae bacterium]|nr:FkbM family methyltransferase [Lachnospiraceae bacterium]